MELKFEIPEHIVERFENLKESLTEDQIKEIALIINMAYSAGDSSGQRQGAILSRSMGGYSNR